MKDLGKSQKRYGYVHSNTKKLNASARHISYIASDYAGIVEA